MDSDNGNGSNDGDSGMSAAGNNGATASKDNPQGSRRSKRLLARNVNGRVVSAHADADQTHVASHRKKKQKSSKTSKVNKKGRRGNNGDGRQNEGATNSMSNDRNRVTVECCYDFVGEKGEFDYEEHGNTVVLEKKNIRGKTSYRCNFLPHREYSDLKDTFSKDNNEFWDFYQNHAFFTNVLEWATGTPPEGKAVARGRYLTLGRNLEPPIRFQEGGTRLNPNDKEEWEALIEKYTAAVEPIVELIQEELASASGCQIANAIPGLMTTLGDPFHQFSHVDHLDPRLRKGFFAVVPLTDEWSMTRLDIVVGGTRISRFYDSFFYPGLGRLRTEGRRSDVVVSNHFVEPASGRFIFPENEEVLEKFHFSCTPPGAAQIFDILQSHGGHYGTEEGLRLFIFFPTYEWEQEDFSLVGTQFNAPVPCWSAEYAWGNAKGEMKRIDGTRKRYYDLLLPSAKYKGKKSGGNVLLRSGRKLGLASKDAGGGSGGTTGAVVATMLDDRNKDNHKNGGGEDDTGGKGGDAEHEQVEEEDNKDGKATPSTADSREIPVHIEDGNTGDTVGDEGASTMPNEAAATALLRDPQAFFAKWKILTQNLVCLEAGLAGMFVDAIKGRSTADTKAEALRGASRIFNQLWRIHQIVMKYSTRLMKINGMFLQEEDLLALHNGGGPKDVRHGRLLFSALEAFGQSTLPNIKRFKSNLKEPIFLPRALDTWWYEFVPLFWITFKTLEDPAALYQQGKIGHSRAALGLASFITSEHLGRLMGTRMLGAQVGEQLDVLLRSEVQGELEAAENDLAPCEQVDEGGGVDKEENGPAAENDLAPCEQVDEGGGVGKEENGPDSNVDYGEGGGGGEGIRGVGNAEESLSTEKEEKNNNEKPKELNFGDRRLHWVPKRLHFVVCCPFVGCETPIVMGERRACVIEKAMLHAFVQRRHERIPSGLLINGCTEKLLPFAPEGILKLRSKKETKVSSHISKEKQSAIGGDCSKDSKALRVHVAGPDKAGWDDLYNCHKMYSGKLRKHYLEKHPGEKFPHLCHLDRLPGLEKYLHQWNDRSGSVKIDERKFRNTYRILLQDMDEVNNLFYYALAEEQIGENWERIFGEYVKVSSGGEE